MGPPPESPVCASLQTMQPPYQRPCEKFHAAIHLTPNPLSTRGEGT